LETSAEKRGKGRPVLNIEDTEAKVRNDLKEKQELQIKNKRARKSEKKLETRNAVKRARNLAGAAKHRLVQKQKKLSIDIAFREIKRICDENN